MLAQGSGLQNGPLNAAGFNSFIDAPGAAAQLHYVAGYQAFYDTLQNSDVIPIALLQFATPADANNFNAGFTMTGYAHQNDLAIPGAQRYDATHPDSSGGYGHAIIAAKGAIVMIVEYDSSNAQHPALLDALAQQQYAKL